MNREAQDDPFRRYVDESGDIVTVVDAEGRLLYVNEAAERIFGAGGSWEGRSAFEFVHPDDRESTEQAFRSWTADEDRRSFSIENRQLQGDTVRRIRWTVTKHLDADGRIVSFFSTARDVTGAREATEELARGEQRLSALLSGMLDPVITIDPAGVVQRASRSVEEVFGYDPEELVGQNIKILMPEPYRSEHDAYLARYGRTGNTWILNRTREFEVVRKDGSRILCELSVSRVDVPGEEEPIFCGSFRDVTDRVLAQRKLEESERRFRAIFDQEYQFVGLLEPDGKVVECNRAGLHVAGKKRAEVVGQPFWEVCWPPEPGLQDRVRRAVRTAARGGFVRFEAELSLPEGRRCVDFSIKPVRGLDGEILYLLPEGRDVTEMKRAQDRENSMLRAFASVGESAAVLAHEIKNPITAVNAALCAVADELGEDHRVVLEELAGKMRQLEKLMRRTLSFVRPLDLKPESREVEPWLRAVVQSLRPVLDARDTTIELEVAAECGAPCFDAQMLEEVVANLIHNASEATGEGGRIRVRAAGVESALEIEVEDNGPGVPDSVRERLFQPFVTSKEGGTGIGLAISRKIVEEHGGSLELDAGELGGACFRIRLDAAG